jgi:L-2,4-diaminobutyric acid acetyltransferase
MTKTSGKTSGISFRPPSVDDGADVWELIRRSGPLDENSRYCNLVQCDHFADTCVIAELDGKIVGWISALIPSDAPDTLFVWQVAVGEAARGQGVAKRMLTHLLERDVCAGIQRLRTTITADNEASWALFNSFADKMDAELEFEPHYDRETHFGGKQATEYMVTIEGIDQGAARESAADAAESRPKTGPAGSDRPA